MHTLNSLLRVGQYSYAPVVVLESDLTLGVTYCHNLVSGEREWVASDTVVDTQPSNSIVLPVGDLDIDVEVADYMDETKSGQRKVAV